jgi:tetratricopeptide (TPR) repeat protein
MGYYYDRDFPWEDYGNAFAKGMTNSLGFMLPCDDINSMYGRLKAISRLYHEFKRHDDVIEFCNEDLYGRLRSYDNANIWVACAFIIRGLAYHQKGMNKEAIEDLTEGLNYSRNYNPNDFLDGGDSPLNILNPLARKVLVSLGVHYERSRPQSYEFYDPGLQEERRRARELEKRNAERREHLIRIGKISGMVVGVAVSTFGLLFTTTWIIYQFSDRKLGFLYLLITLVLSGVVSYFIIKYRNKWLIIALAVFVIMGWLAVFKIIPERIIPKESATIEKPNLK